MGDSDGVVAEVVRVIVSPAAGVLRFGPAFASLEASAWIAIGETVGEVMQGADSTPILATSSGSVGGVLALDGERVRAGASLVWMWAGPAND